MIFKKIYFCVILLVIFACGNESPTTQDIKPSPTIPTNPTETTVIGSNVSSPTLEVAPSPTELNPPLDTLPSPIATSQPHGPSHHLAGEAIKLDQISMADTTNGWGLSGAEVFVTTDGALTWSEVTPPQELPSDSKIQTQGYFLDQSTAWIIFSINDQIPTDAVIWHTTNAGETWMPSAPLNHEAYGDQVWAEFSAFDATHAWLMIRGVYVGAGTHYATQFFRTTDGGLTWMPLIGDVGNDYTGLVFESADNGLLTWQTTGAYASAPPDYAITIDGAINWTIKELPPPQEAPNIFETSPYCESYQPRFLPDHSIRILVGCFDEYDPPHIFSSYLYASSDIGRTWTSIRLPDSILGSNTTIQFYGLNEGLLLSRKLYWSHDGGKTWSDVKTVYWDGQFSFPTISNGWAIARSEGKSALVETGDFGQTWVEIKPVVAHKP